jgi:hypothetical protein
MALAEAAPNSVSRSQRSGHSRASTIPRKFIGRIASHSV